MTISKEYIAGFFDGEGCVNFTPARKYYIPRVLLVNSNEEVLREIQKLYGGDVRRNKRHKQNWKSTYTLRISNRAAYLFLKDIYPYLIVKRLQAQTIFGWAAIAPGSNGQWDMKALNLIVERMKLLNKRGVHNERDPVDILLEKCGIDVDTLVI